MMPRCRDQFDGGILGSFVKSPAKRHEKAKKRTTLDEVAGLENAKDELQEVVDFLKSPEKFQRLGGRIPRASCWLARRARARRCSPVRWPARPASRLQHLRLGIHPDVRRRRRQPRPRHVQDGQGKQPLHPVHRRDRRRRPDARRRRGRRLRRTGADAQPDPERDGRLPAERDVIVLAATNRPDVLDSASAPGRFDRHVTVDRPTCAAGWPSSRSTSATSRWPTTSTWKRSRSTIGMSGADLANLANEAAPPGHAREQSRPSTTRTSTPRLTRSSWRKARVT